MACPLLSRSCHLLPFFAGCLGAAFLFSSQARADQSFDLKSTTPGNRALDVSLDYRIQGSFITDFPVDAEGTRLGQEAVLDQRLRLSLGLRQASFKLATEWDVLTGQLAGDTWDVPGEIDERRRHTFAAVTADGVTPRRLAVSAAWKRGQVEAGLVTSHWGLGMLANDGDQQPLFGRNDFGDRVIRLRTTMKPFASSEARPLREHLYLTFAADLVVADDLAQISDGQIAGQGIVSMLLAPPDGRRFGLYMVYRHQRELAQDRRTNALVVDGFGQRSFGLGETGWKLDLGLEAATILGSTNRSLSYNERESLNILSGGLAAQVRFRGAGDAIRVHLRAGWASGDRDPDDGQLSDFSFDRDYDVGFVLFDQVQGAIEAAAHALLVDPEHGGSPPDGVDAIATEGAFRRAAYLQPAVQVVPFEWLDLRGGLTFAAGTAPTHHPFYSFRAGGSPRNHRNLAPTNKLLGSELHWSLLLGGQLPVGSARAPSLRFRVQGGHLFLGGALQSGDGDIVHHVLLTGLVGW